MVVLVLEDLKKVYMSFSLLKFWLEYVICAKHTGDIHEYDKI